jgi:hypothetical protein
MMNDQESPILRQLGRIETKVDTIGSRVEKIELRVQGLEWWKAKVLGVAAAVSFIAQFLFRNAR